MKVILDTNALMMPFEFKLNIDLELQRLLGAPECMVPSCVMGELKKLARDNRHARAALKLASKYPVVEVESPGDSGVIEAAKKTGGYVLTNDRGLIRRLRNEKLGVITLKNNHLVIEYDST